MDLNEQLSWQQAGDTLLGSGVPVSSCFRGQHAEKVPLQKGTILYKFNNDANLINRSGTISPWWSPYREYQHDPGWEQRRKLARQLGVSVRELGRVTSAITESWNTNAYLLVITLAERVYGFWGGFAAQDRLPSGEASKRLSSAPVGAAGAFKPEARGATARLPGGGTQFYIPNLTVAHVAQWRAESLLAE